MQKVKIFKSHVNEVNDTNYIESNLNTFIKDKKIISVTQSVVAKPNTPDAATCRKEATGPLYFIVITVVYDEEK